MDRQVMGIDVSKETLDYSMYDGKTHVRGSLKNHPKGIKQFFGQYDHKKDTLHVVMEATGTYHLRLIAYLYGAGFKFSVMNPLIIKRYSESKMFRAKTDSVDACLISIYGYEQSPPLFIPRAKHQQEMINLLKAVEDLIETRSEYERRLEALNQNPDAMGVVIRSFKQLIRTVNSKIERLEQMALQIAETHYNDDLRRLVSIKSVGEKTAVVILAYFGCFENFESSKQVMSYIGSNPSPHRSGTSIYGRGSISKKGNSYIRKQLFMTTLTAIQHNPACKDFYNRLREKGKEHKVARIAAMNKLIKQIFAIVKYQRTFDPNFVFSS
ncbi:MAG: IS110 family transposase [Candidatus Neomarinimicrobiota bacterium]